MNGHTKELGQISPSPRKDEAEDILHETEAAIRRLKIGIKKMSK